jgi:thiol-disulfide isomerase/thioredoxin
MLLAISAARAPAHHELSQLDLAAHRNQVVYLDFWASWCAPCRQSFEFMNVLQRDFGPQGLVVIAVNVDTDRRLAEAFLAEHPVGFDIVYDPAGRLPAEWKLEGMPTTVLIGRDGAVRERHVGFRPADRSRLRASVARLLAERVR